MRHTAARRLLRAARVLLAAKLNLADWGLEGLQEGRPVTCYHGTTRSFTSFDMGRNREELVNKFYGTGIFLVPSKSVAERYALANRNIGFDPEIIEDLKHRNSRAGALMATLYKVGNDGWELLLEELRKEYPKEAYPMTLAAKYLGVDPNTVADVCQYIIGSKDGQRQSADDFVNIFDMRTGMPAYIYDLLDALGLDSNVYRPKVYTVEVTAQNPLVTSSKVEARAARSKGHDCVVYYGEDLVGDLPEVAVFDASNTKVTNVEVV